MAAGSLSGALSGLTELRTLNLTGNALTGTLPASLATLSKLQTLDLSNCTALQARRVDDQKGWCAGICAALAANVAVLV